MPRIFLLPFTRIALAFLMSIVVGTAAVLLVATIDNLNEAKQIRHRLKTQIGQTTDAYRSSHPGAGAGDVTRFIERYVIEVLPAEVTVVPGAGGAARAYGKPIWSGPAESGAVRLYLNPAYMKEETTGADIGEIADGILVALLAFFGSWVYIVKNEQAKLERRIHDEERRRLTAALHEQEAYALLGRMSATLSHELRTPVATISNLVQSLPQRVDDRRFMERFVRLSREELERMQRIMDNLLIYGKALEVVQPAWVDVAQLIRDNASRHVLTVNVERIKCKGDKFYLDLLFANLLRNSAEAGASTVRISLSGPAAGDRLHIAYEDDGRGFPAELDLKTLLAPFVTTRSKGAGLGLYLADKIMRAHGGELEPFRPVQGAGFRLWWPSVSLVAA